MRKPVLRVVQGDITQVAADVIVNAANSSLMGGGGVDGAIHRVGGKAILAACEEIRSSTGPCPPGEAVVTTAGNLAAKYVIHTVGPIWEGGDQDEARLLANCYLNSLRKAEEYGAHRIAFPNISTGAYGYPKDKAAQIATSTVQNFQSAVIEEVLFVCFDDENFTLYKALLGN